VRGEFSTPPAAAMFNQTAGRRAPPAANLIVAVNLERTEEEEAQYGGGTRTGSQAAG